MGSLGFFFFANNTWGIMKGGVLMEIIDTSLMAKLNDMIEEATKTEEYKLAKSLGSLQIEIIEERTKAWEKGFESGYALGVKKSGYVQPKSHP